MSQKEKRNIHVADNSSMLDVKLEVLWVYIPWLLQDMEII